MGGGEDVMGGGEDVMGGRGREIKERELGGPRESDCEPHIDRRMSSLLTLRETCI